VRSGRAIAIGEIGGGGWVVMGACRGGERWKEFLSIPILPINNMRKKEKRGSIYL
jgi:hypothetical protein